MTPVYSHKLRSLSRLLASTLALFLSANICLAQRGGRGAQPAPVTYEPLKPTAIYDLGEKAGWVVTVTDPTIRTINYTIKKNGLDVYKQGTLDVSSGHGTIETSLDEPGSLLLQAATVQSVPPAPTAAELETINTALKALLAKDDPAAKTALDNNPLWNPIPVMGLAGGGGGGARGGIGGGGAQRTVAGLLVAPNKLQPSSPRPADFDSWWDSKIKQLHDIPVNAQLTAIDSPKAGVDYYKIQMDNINGVHIQGQLAKPATEGKHPALLILQWAGVYSLPPSRVVDRAAEGWIALNIEPHDIAFDQPMAYYNDLMRTTLNNYQAIGQDDREKSYFLQMYLSAYRALDYLASRDDWDGKTLVVQGTSMGGQQSLSMAGLHPKVSAVIVMVPSSNDATGPEHGSAAGFPDWAKDAKSKNNPKILETAQYFDPMNFSYHTKVPALVAMGLLDETSPAPGVWRAINQMKGPVEPLPMINSPHQDTPPGVQKPYQTRSQEWLDMLVKGVNPTDPSAAAK